MRRARTPSEPTRRGRVAGNKAAAGGAGGAHALSTHRLMLLEVLLHAADISNPIKPWLVYEKWANLAMELQ